MGFAGLRRYVSGLLACLALLALASETLGHNVGLRPEPGRTDAGNLQRLGNLAGPNLTKLSFVQQVSNYRLSLPIAVAAQPAENNDRLSEELLLARTIKKAPKTYNKKTSSKKKKKKSSSKKKQKKKKASPSKTKKKKKK